MSVHRLARNRIGSRGTTVTEVLMAISVLAIGAAGIFSLQKLTVVANRDAKNLEVANQIARTWISRLQSEALKWNYPAADGLVPEDLDTDTVWLKRVNTTNAWFRPSDGTLGIFGEHDAFGNDDPSDSHAGPYCVNLRLTRIGNEGNLIRAEVRVYWLRQGIQSGAAQLSAQPANPLCGANANAPPDVDASPDVYHVVHAVTGLFKNMPK